MLRLARSALLAVPLVIACASAQAGPADALDSAMRCVHAQMTSSLLPVGVANERIADAALARCFDEIENAAMAVADKRTAIDSVRTSLRMQLYDYALQVAGAAQAVPAYAADTGRNQTPDASRNW